MTCKINIVLLTDCLGNITGGAEKQIFELAKRLPKSQYNVFIASLEAQGKTSLPLIESIDCRLRIFRLRRIYGPSGLVQGFKFFSFLRKNSINILMTYHFGSDIWGTFWGHWAGVPLIISNRRDMGFWRHGLHVWAYRLVNPWVNKIVAVTFSIKAMILKQEHVPDDKVHVIYNGVEDGLLYDVDVPKRKVELGLKPHDRVIMHVANLRPVKGHRFLIQACAQLAGVLDDVKLVLIGKDELEGRLQGLAFRLGVRDKILFLGERNDVKTLLPLADICVLPSLSEGGSNAILEYMAFGKPVVATQVGGNPELISHGLNGLLIEQESVESLDQALRNLLNDENKRRIMGHNGFLRARGEFSMETMVRRYDELFKGVGGNKKINVLHLVSSGGLFGAEQVILNLASFKGESTSWVGAIRNRHNPHVEIIDEAKHLGLRAAVFDSHKRFDYKTIFLVKRFLKENNIHVVHTHNYKSDMIGFLATRLTPVKWVATNHVWHGTNRRLRFYETIDAFILKKADKVFAVSAQIKETLIKKGFKARHVDVIHNGIDISRWGNPSAREHLRHAWGVRPKDTLLAIVGRLSPEKGHEFLFRALKKIIPRSPAVKCLIVGDGPSKINLEKMVRDFYLSDHVIFTGIRKDMPDVYGASDVMVNASLIEGLPMTILEAMASRLVVVATPVGGVPQIIRSQENGVMVKPGDIDALAEVILDLVSHPEKRKKLAEAAYHDACAAFNDAVMGRQYKHSYENIIFSSSIPVSR